MGDRKPWEAKAVRCHLWLSIASVLGVLLNGLFAYRLLDNLSPSFYYLPDQRTLMIWLGIDGIFLSLFSLGAILFLAIVLRGVRRREEPAGVEPAGLGNSS